MRLRATVSEPSRRLRKLTLIVSIPIAGWFAQAHSQTDHTIEPDLFSNSGTVLTDESIDEDFPLFHETHLQQGRVVWMDNCRNCHERGVAGAAIVTKFEAWEKRIEKGKPTLYQHAINGFFGEDDSMMPAKGGNEELSDEQVQRAVDYMVAAAIYFKEIKK